MVVNGVEVEVPTYQMFKKQLRMQGRNYRWLAENMGYSYCYTNWLLNGRTPLLENHIQILSELLEMPLTPVQIPPNN